MNGLGITDDFVREGVCGIIAFLTHTTFVLLLQMMELKQRDETQRHQLEATKRELDSLGEKLKEAESKLAETAKKADNFEKQTLQVH